MTMATKAESYKSNGYTHVVVERVITSVDEWDEIKGFKNYYQMRKYKRSMPPDMQNSWRFSFMTVNKAIKKGY